MATTVTQQESSVKLGKRTPPTDVLQAKGAQLGSRAAAFDKLLQAAIAGADPRRATQVQDVKPDVTAQQKDTSTGNLAAKGGPELSLLTASEPHAAHDALSAKDLGACASRWPFRGISSLDARTGGSTWVFRIVRHAGWTI